MPRFNFSAYVVRNSLTDFSNIRDLDPQGEWEAKKKASHIDDSSNEFSAQIAKENYTSTSTSDLEKTLHDEVQFLTKELFEAGVEILESSDNSTENSKTEKRKYAETYPEPKYTNVEYQIGDSGFQSCLDLDETSFIATDVARNAMSATNSQQEFAPPRSSTPTSVGDVKESTPEHSREPSISGRQKQPYSASGDYSATSQTKSQAGSSASPSTTSTKNYRLLMALDDIGTLQPMKNRDEIDEFFRSVSNDDLLLPKKDILDAVTKFKDIPVTDICHFSTLGEYVRHLYKNERITDVNIRIGSHCFATHRIAIACFSEYFAELFYKREGKQKVPLDIRLRGIRPEAFQTFVDFVYTSKMEINTDIIGDLLVMADYLRIPKLKAMCADFVEHMPLEQALLLLQSGQLKSSSQLYKHAITCVSENFSDLSKRNIFLRIDCDTLCLILSHDNLVIETEMEVFRAGLRWLAFSLNERKGDIEKVMSCVRFAYMKQEELFECMSVTDLLRASNVCRMMVLKANWIVSARNMKIEDPMNFPTVKPRQCFSKIYNKESDLFYSAHSMQGVHIEVTTESQMDTAMDSHMSTLADTTPLVSSKPTPSGEILAFGGFQKGQEGKDIKDVKSVERYHLGDNQWKHCTNLPEPRLHHAAATLSGKMYISGGTDPSKSTKKALIATKDAFVLNIEINEWKQIAPMNTARMNHSLCALFGMIYAVGGQDDKNRILKTVECYNPMTDNWFYVKPMLKDRYGAGTAVLDGKLFVAGGYGDSVSKKYGLTILKSVECFDPRSNTWSAKNDLRFPRCLTSLVTVNNELFICGGLTRATTTSKDSVLTSTSSIDVYNKDSDIWEQKTKMVVPRHSAGVTTIDGKIYVVGGMSTVTESMLQSIECYDVIQDAWLSGVQELPYPARWLCCVAVPDKHK